MKEMKERIEKVYNSMIKEEKGFVSSMNKTLIFYIIIIIVLGGYTVFLNIKIKELATPTNLAIAINTQVRNSIPRFAQQIKHQMQPGAKQMAYKSVEAVHAVIPQATEFAKNQINFYIDQLWEKVEREHLEKVQAIFDESLSVATKHKDIVADKNLGKALAETLSEHLDKEVSEIVNNSFLNAVDDLRNEIDKLRTKNPATLTQKENAEKMFILYWLSIVERGDTGGGIFADIISLTNETIEGFCSSTTVQ
ncbi:MAG: hypothetical protein WC071_07600 [Victivallaceae bacterium]